MDVAIDGRRDGEAAPGRLRLVQRFVNTVDVEHGHEDLTEPRRLKELLVELALLDARAAIGADVLLRALELREALRNLALANNGGKVASAAAAVLEEAASRGRLVVRFDRGVPSLEPASRNADGALADLVGVVYTAIADGTWSRLKACRREVCGRLFYDRSRNRSAVWCQMAVCGNRVKTRAYRARRSEGRQERSGRP